MGVACSSRIVRVSQVLSSSSPRIEESTSEDELELELAADEDRSDRSRSDKVAVVPASDPLESETPELMLEGTSRS